MLTPQFVYDGHVQESPYKELVEISNHGQLVCVKRDKSEEEAFVAYLQSLHPNFNRQLNGVFHLPFAEAQKKQWFFKVYHRFLEADIEIVGMDMLRHFRYSPHQVETTANTIEEQDNITLIDMEVKFGKETVAIHDLQKMLLAGQRAVLLKDDSLGILTDEWLQRYGAIVRHGKVQNKRIRVSKWIALTGQQDERTSSGIALVDKAEWWNRLKAWQETTDILYPLPSSIKVNTLRPYQQKGYEWMRLLADAGAGACLADDMGLGKTIQAICFLAHRAEQHPQARHLVVAPTSLIYNWKQELEKFAPGIAVLVFHGSQRDCKTLSDEKVKIILTSYGTIRSDIGLFAAHRFDTIVIDESHNIKNPDALITKAVNQLQASTRITLSGTPIMNNTFDIYSQLNFILPDFLGSKEFFRKQYADPIDRDRDEAKIKALQKLTSLFILRRTKEQVATDLPPKTETILWCDMKGEQREAYDTIKENIRSSLFLQVKQKGLAANKLSILTGLMKLRQICNSTELVPDDQLNRRESVKTEVLLEELKSITKNHKVLVFSQFTKMLDILEREVSKQQLSYLRLDGSTGSEERQELVNRFNDENGDEKLFLLSLKAGNAGLNLTAADYVFLFDPWWSPAVEQQAIDRTHRIGQTRKVFAYKMICKDTIEERIVELQHRKKTLSHELIGAEEGFLNQLSEDDLEYLFS
jgi:SNF2 family DNA or RNA helicase